MDIICYSCGRGENPENTLEGIEHCLQVNPDWRIEMDVQLTLDERLVLFHDYNTKRTTGEDKLINELNLKDVQQLNAGYSFRDNGKYIYRPDPLEVPELREVFIKFPQAKVLLDIHTNNPKVVQLLIELIYSKFDSGDFIIASEYDKIIKEFKKERSHWRYGVPEKEAKKMLYSSFLKLDNLFPIKSDILMLPKNFGKINVLSRRVINHAKKRNIPIWAWMYEGEEVRTVTSLKQLEELKQLGVDGVFTACPLKLKGEME